MKKLPFFAFVAICIVVFTFFWFDSKERGLIPSLTSVPTLFSKPISELGLGFDSYGYYVNLYPDDTNLFFTAINQKGDTFENGYFLADLESGAINPVDGVPFSGTEESDFLIIATGTDVSVQDLVTGAEYKTTLPEVSFSASVSPLKKKIAFNTISGIYVFDIPSQTQIQISQNQYDGAYAWIDENTIFGFRQTNENLFEAGNGRVLAVWNLSEKSYIDIPIKFPYKTIRNAEWVVPGIVARVSAGFDDGSFDTLVNVTNYNVVDLGDTSGMMMGGVKSSQEFKRVALVGMRYDGESFSNNVELYDEKGTQIYKKVFEDALSRESVEFINENTLIYIRKDVENRGSSDIVKLDISTGFETVLNTIPNVLYTYALSSDKKTLIAPSGATMLRISL